jgi:copper homeostasis protein CutC
MDVGGTTPDPALIGRGAALGTPVHVTIRPHVGDFVYASRAPRTSFNDEVHAS